MAYLAGFAMGDSEDPVGINDKIEILSTDDDRIKAVGELLSSDTGRSILKLLFNDQMTANQIAQKTEVSLPLVIYHLKKMQDAGIVKIAQTGKNTKSHDMKYYTVDKFAIVILPSGVTEKAKSSKSLHNSFNRIYRFATIGGAGLAAWFSSQFIQQQNNVSVSDDGARQAEMAMEESSQMMQKSAPASTPMMESADVPADVANYGMQTMQTGEPMTDVYISIIVALGVVIVGLVIERIWRSRKH